MKTPLDKARALGLIKWPPYFAQLLAPGGRARRGRTTRLAEIKSEVLYHLAHVLPERPWEPLQEAIYLAFKTRKLVGDYAEFGVFSGRSTVRSHYYIKAALRGATRRIVAFDSFQGLPRLDAADQVRYSDYAEGSYACSEADYRSNVVKYGVPDDLVVTVPGWFADTCNAATAGRIGLDKIAVAHVDCDIYSATLTVLRFVGDLLEDGGIIVFDDWGSYRGHPELGQRGALAEWMRERPDLWITTERADASGSAFVSVHKKLSERERIDAQR